MQTYPETGVRIGRRQRSIIAVPRATLMENGATCQEMEFMLPPSLMIDWARCLLAYETVAGKNPLQPQAATFLVYEKLRGQLRAPMGADGFQAFATRALMLAKSEAPELSALQVTADGGLEGLGELEPQTDVVDFGEIGLIFIAQLLGLFLTFLGPETTRKLVQQVFPFLEIAKGTEAAKEPDTSIPFESILEQAEELRSLSERLEALADKHPAVEVGLMTIAGNTRNLASILDVLVAIRSKSQVLRDSTTDQGPDASLTGYVM
jgi:hypothetical protein